MSDRPQFAIRFRGIDQLSNVVGRIQGTMGRLADRSAQLGKRFEGIGTRLSIAGAGASYAAGKMKTVISDIMRPAIALDTAAAKIRSMPGITETAVNRITGAGRRWSRNHTNTADEYVETSYMMLSAGLDEAQSIAATATAMSVATATMGDAGQTANLLATIYNNMGDKTKSVRDEMEHLGDVVTMTQQVFQFADMAALNEGMKYAMPTALQFRMSLEETSAIVGQLSNAGIQGGQAGTSFAAAMRAMTKASQELGFEMVRDANGNLDFIATLKDIKAIYGDLADLTDEEKLMFQSAFGADGERAITLLASSLEDLEKNYAAVQENAGATAKAAKIVENSLSGQAKIIENNFNDLKIDFATQLIPEIRKAIPEIKHFVAEIRGVLAENPGLVKQIATWGLIATALLTVAGPALLVLGSLASLFGTLLSGGRIVMAVGGFIWKFAGFLFGLGGRGLWLGAKVFPLLLNVFRLVGIAFAANPIGATIAAIALLAGVLIANWDKVGPYFEALWAWVKEKALGFWEWFKGAFMENPLGAIKALWEPVKTFFGGLWDSIKEKFAGVWDWISTKIVEPIKSLKSTLGSAWGKVTAAFGASDDPPDLSGGPAPGAPPTGPLMALAGGGESAFHAEFNIYAAAHQSATDIGKAVRAELEKWQREQAARRRGALHDGGGD